MGPLLGASEINPLRQAIEKHVNANSTKLIIDLSGVPHMNSTALGVLVSAGITYSRRNWQLKVCGVNKAVHAVFVVTKVNLLLDMVATRDEAVRSFI